MSVKEYINRVVQVPESEWDFFASRLRHFNLGKGEFFFEQGEFPTEIGFVLSGLLYNYYTSANGVKHVKKFSAASAPVASYSSMIAGQPTFYSCEALEETQMVTIKFSVLQELYKRHACWANLGRIIAEKLYLEKEFREREFLTHDAKTRYETFKKQRPELLERVPQYLIASYLGITPVSLSRLKHV